MADYSGWPELIIAGSRLPIKRTDHFTSDRFIAMLIRHFRNSDRVIVFTNKKTEEFTSGIIEIFCDAFKVVKEDKSIVKRVKNDGTEIMCIRIVLDKIPACRR